MIRAVAIAALLAGCAALDQYSDCSTDTECELQCVAELQPDESPEVCAISLAAVEQ